MSLQTNGRRSLRSRLFSVQLAIALLLLVTGGTAAAERLAFSGVVELEIGTLPPIGVTGTGVATVNGLGGTGHLTTLAIAGGITGGDVVPITDPIVTQGGIVLVEASGTLGTGTLRPISGAFQSTLATLTQGTLPIQGQGRLCLFSTGCGAALEFPFTESSGARGWGIGGLITAGGNGGIRVSVVAAPWTVNTQTATNRTNNGGLTFPTSRGFAHGPSSGTSSTGVTGGLVQLITPLQVTTVGVPGNNDQLALFGRLTLRFVPEPTTLLALGFGAAGLVLLGRRRARRDY